MWAMLGASGLVFIPLALLSLAAGWGIVGVWVALVALIVARVASTGWRFQGSAWVVIGPHPPAPVSGSASAAAAAR
jgi:Na+-driven multidrug efflux pump